MNQDQLLSLLRQLLPIFGTLAISFGWTTPDKWAAWSTTIMSVAGPIMVLVGIVWGFLAHTKTATLTAAAALPEVKKIELSASSPESAALARATPPEVVVAPSP